MCAYKRISPQPVAEGGTGAITLTAHGVLLGEGTSAITPTAVGTTGQVLTGVTGADPVWASPAASSISITGDSGGALTGAAFTFTGGTTGITFSGSGSTETLVGTLVVSNGGTGRATLTNHGVLIGAGTTAITQTAVGTNGQVFLGATAADPGWVTPAAGTGLSITTNSTTLSYALSTPVSIANGGTNATSMTTTDGVVYYDGTSLVTTTAGTSGQVLTSNGAGVAPTYQAAGGGGLLSSTTVLTSSQVKNLHGTPITAIAAPGSGNLLWVVQTISKLTYGGSNVFVAGAGQVIALYYASVSNNNKIYNVTPNSGIVASASTYDFANGTFALTEMTASQIENQALVLYNSSATEISGNAAGNNTITIQIIYKIVTI